jgi:cytochrome c
VGPLLRGVVGRKVASVAGYQYSDALKGVNGRWDARRLEMWLRDPQSIAPGTKMAFSLPSATERRAVTRYLASIGASADAVER